MPAKLTDENAVAWWFVGLDGEPQPLLATLEDISRDGFEGHAFRRQPAKAEPFELTGIVTCAAADLATVEAGLTAMQGTIVSYTDHRSRTFSDLACLAARVLSTKSMMTPSGAIDVSTGAAGSGHDRMIACGFLLQQI